MIIYGGVDNSQEVQNELLAYNTRKFILLKYSKNIHYGIMYISMNHSHM